MGWFSHPKSALPVCLSAEEAAELAGQVAELSKAGLPLEGGLLALADELPGRRVRRVLREIAGQLSAGTTLQAAFEAQGPRLPAHLRGLVLAAIRSGNLAQVLEEFVDLQRSQAELRRRLWLSLAYPIVLLVAVLILVVFLVGYLVPDFEKTFRGFRVDLPPVTRILLTGSGPAVHLAGPLGLLLVVLVLSAAMPDAPGLSRLIDWIPIIGRLWRWGRLAYFSRLMGLLLAQRVPLPEALRLTAAALPHAALAAGCRRAAAEVEAGRPLSASLAAQRQFPPTLIPLVQWGERTPALAEAFRAAAEMFEGRAQYQHAFLEAILVPALFVMILAFVGIIVVALFLPLISLIQHLA
jgi:general secretion pathway protein F